MAKVTLQNVSKNFGASLAIKDLHLEAADREFLVLLGPSGAGKSTLLRIIAGLEKATAGDVFIGDRRVNGVPPKDRHVAMVFATAALFPHLTVGENLAVGHARHGSAVEAKKRVQETAGILGLGRLLEQKPPALSAAEAVRVAIGRAMVGQPKVFLFDDPLAQLDAGPRAELRAEISRLHERVRTTIIYATRDADEAMILATRIAVMKAGRIEQIDAPATIYGNPASLSAAALIGNPPMNLLHGKLKEVPEGVAFKEANGGVMEGRWSNPGLRPFAGRDVVLGLRAEHLHLVPGHEVKSDRHFQALVDFVEPMGAQTYVHLHTGAHALVCQAAGNIAREEAGHRMRFEIDPAGAKFFDTETGARLA